jgi:hypothetical protein
LWILLKLGQFDLARKAYLRLCMLPHHMPLLYTLPSQPFLAGAAQPYATAFFFYYYFIDYCYQQSEFF